MKISSPFASKRVWIWIYKDDYKQTIAAGFRACRFLSLLANSCVWIDFVRGLVYNIWSNRRQRKVGARMEYLSIRQTADKWGISIRRIQVLCTEGRIPGAMKIGSYWAIPADAEKPDDQRVKSGKYIKNKEQ